MSAATIPKALTVARALIADPSRWTTDEREVRREVPQWVAVILAAKVRPLDKQRKAVGG